MKGLLSLWVYLKKEERRHHSFAQQDVVAAVVVLVQSAMMMVMMKTAHRVRNRRTPSWFEFNLLEVGMVEDVARQKDDASKSAQAIHVQTVSEKTKKSQQSQRTRHNPRSPPPKKPLT